MLRTLVVIPLAVIVAAVLCLLLCWGLSIRPQVGQMLLAAAICAIAGEIGLLCVVRRRTTNVASLFQAAWVGSILHLVVSLALAAVTMLSLKPGSGFILWLLAMYWATLIAMCGVFIKFLRTPASPAGTGTN